MARQANMGGTRMSRWSTSVASEHILELMRSLETIQSEKSRLIAAVRPGGVAVLNGDDARAATASLAPGKVWTSGSAPTMTCARPTSGSTGPGAGCGSRNRQGRGGGGRDPDAWPAHDLPALAALTVAAIEGVPWPAAAAALAGTQPMRARLEVVPVDGGVTLPSTTRRTPRKRSRLPWHSPPRRPAAASSWSHA